MAQDDVDLGAVVRALRQEAGLSQRAFAELVGTSGPTVAAYESGAKEPRWSTVVRMAGAIGFELALNASPAGVGARQRQRRARRRRALAAAAGASVAADWSTAEAIARQNLDRLRESAPSSAQRWVERWAALVDAGAEAVSRQLLEEGDEADDMRQMTPFAGLLTDPERRAAIAAVDALA